MTFTSTQETISAPKKHFDLRQHVTDTIIKQLEEGTVPWQQPWTENENTLLRIPKNVKTNAKYRGINILLLWSASIQKQFASNEWASLDQWNFKKEKIRKDEKGNMIVFYDKLKKEVDGELKEIPYLKYSKVFNRCQLESYIPTKTPLEENKKTLVEKIDKADDFISNTFANIKHLDQGAYYTQMHDTIYMPEVNSFIDTPNCSATENYYSTLFHELTHWTGHPKRLDRKAHKKFGDETYAGEELIAELGTAFITAEFEITNPDRKDNAAYIANWLKVLRNNKDFIFAAASEASKAVDYLKELQPLKLVL